MGNGKRRFNTKGRQIVETIIDNSTTKNVSLLNYKKFSCFNRYFLQIKLEFAGESEYGGVDQSNIEVLPSQKRTTKIKKKEGHITRILSKKQRKHLEQVIDKKKKKENVRFHRIMFV